MMLPEYTPLLILAIPFIGALITPLIGRIGDRCRNSFVILVLLVNAVLVLLFASMVWENGIFSYVFGAQDISVPVAHILFEVDGLGVLMAVLSSLLLLVAAVYSWGFLKDASGLDKYYMLMLLFEVGIIGVIFTGDLFNFFVFLVMTIVAMAGLVSFWTDRAESVVTGFTFLVVGSLSTLCVLFAVGLLYGQYNVVNFAELASSLEYTFLDKAALALLVAAFGMIVGVAPMHMWLNDSFVRSPASVSMTLVGVSFVGLYGLLRIVFVVFGNALSMIAKDVDIAGFAFQLPLHVALGWFIIALAVVTILIGVILALGQNDIKKLIAFGVLAEIGYIVLGVGAGIAAIGTAFGRTALEGGLFHMFNDAFIMGLLFLVAGAIYYGTKERLLENLGGLAHNMKYTAVFFIIGVFAVSGMPPFSGFASKLLIYESVFQLNPILAIVAVLSSFLLLAVFLKLFILVFLGPKLPRFANVKEVPQSMLIAMGILVVIIVFMSLFPQYIFETIVEPGVDALLEYQSYITHVLSGGV